MASSERTETGAETGTETRTETGAPPRSPAGSQPDTEGRRPEAHPGSLSGTETATSALKDGLRCDLLMNARYHSIREAFLDSVHRVLMFLIIVLGAAAVTDLFNAPWIKGLFAACAVIFAALDLTADLSNRARCHALMKRRYFELLADLTSGRSPTEIEAQMHRCSADEEPAFHALMAVSWNAAQEMVYGEYADKYAVPALHRFLKNIRRYGQVNYPYIKGSRPATA
jgi:hypothetical protein